MSSARKRQKSSRVAAMIDHANQQKMLAKHHANVMGTIATELARQHDSLKHWQNCAAGVLARFINLSAQPADPQEWGAVALEATRLLNMGPNAKVTGSPALSASPCGLPS